MYARPGFEEVSCRSLWFGRRTTRYCSRQNYAAKAFGIKTGDAVWQAKQKCRNLVVVPPHFEEYIKYSKLARSVYSRYTDQVEPYGMDECWLDVSGTENIFGSPEKVANDIRETIKFELGLTISVGVSFNKIFAKLGSDMKKPDAVTVIPKDSFQEKYGDSPQRTCSVWDGQRSVY